MAEYTAGVAKVEIRPNLSGFSKRLKAELERINAQFGVEIRPDLSDFREQLRAEMANLPTAEIDVDVDAAAAKGKIAQLGRDQKLTIQAEADTTDAKSGIEYLTRPQKVTVEVDADTAPAKERIDRAAKKRHTTVEVDADTAAAKAKIAAAARDRKAKIDVDTGGAAAGLSSMATQAAGAASSLGMVAAQATGIGIIGVAAAGCIGPLASVAAAASGVIGVLGVLPGIAASAAAGLATLGIGLSGVGAAFSAMGKSAGGAADDTADKLKQLQRQVESAERGLVQANRRVEDAERRVEDAQKNTRKAQDALNDARKEAVKDLKELKGELEDAALGEEEAVLAVARARQSLIDAQADKDSSGLDIAEADLAYRKAVKNLDEVREKNNQLAKDVQAANDAGIEGSQKVQDAKEKVEAATRGEADAQRALLEANENVLVAQERLDDALENLAKGASSAAGGVDPFAEALANLSPKAQEFVLAMQALGDQWQDLKFAVQDNLFDGLAEDVTNLATVQLPVLKTGLAGIASEINTGLRANIAALSSEASQTGLATMLENTRQAFAGTNQAAGPLTQAIVDIGAASSAYLPQLGQYLGEAGARLGEFLTQATQTGQFDQWVQNGINTLKGIGQTLADVGGIISGVFQAAAAAGQSSLGPLGQVLSMVNEFVNSVQGQQALGSFFSSMTDGLAALMPILSTALTSIGTTIMPAISDFIQQAAPGVQMFVQGFADGLSALAPAMGPIGQLLSDIGAALAPLLPVLGELLTAALVPVAQGLSQVVGALAPVIQIAATALTPLIQQLAPIFSDLVGMLADLVTQYLGQLMPFLPQMVAAWQQIFDAVAPLIPVFTKLAFDIISPLIGVIGALMPAIVGLVQVFATIITAVAPVIAIIGELIGAVVKVLAAIINFVVQAVTNWDSFKARLIAATSQFITKIISSFQQFISRAVSLIVDFGKRLVNQFVAMWNNASGAVANGVKIVVEKVKSIRQLVLDVFKGAKDWLINAGKTIISGLWNGMKDMWENVTEWFSDKLSAIRSPFSSRASRHATGSVRRYAAGGEDHSPQIAAGGEWRVWAEPETGGEAYIPLANDYRRSRAVAITAAVADHFGYNLVDAKGKGFAPVAKDSLGPTDVRAFAEGGITIEDLDTFASDLEGKPYVWGGVHWGDCSGAMSAIARYTAGVDPWGGRFTTASEKEGLNALGFLPGLGPSGSLQIGWYNGGPGGGHTSGTLPSGTNVEMGGGRGNGQFGGSAAPANHPQYTDHAHVPAEFFAPIKVPRMGGLGDIDFGHTTTDGASASAVETTDPSGDKLKTFRASGKSDPDSYVTGAKSDGPSSISEIVADFAKTAAAGHTKDLLGLVGISDDIPMVKAYSQWLKARQSVSKRSGTAAKQKEITSLSQAAASVIDADPQVDTVEVTGLDLVGGLSPIKAPKADDGDIDHVYVPGGGAEQWRGMAMAAMRRVGFNADDPAQVNAMIKQIQSESGGDPNIAQQIVDVNGSGESAGVGLLQIIPATYAAHRDPELPDDRRNPFSNMVAALRYYRSRYGFDLTTMWGQGHGYAGGGLVEGPGGPTDDLIPAWISNGEFVVREAATRHARPLLEMLNADPQHARAITQAVTGTSPTPPKEPSAPVEVHYHIETNNVEEGLRRSEMHARQQVMAMNGA